MLYISLQHINYTFFIACVFCHFEIKMEAIPDLILDGMKQTWKHANLINIIRWKKTLLFWKSSLGHGRSDKKCSRKFCRRSESDDPLTEVLVLDFWSVSDYKEDEKNVIKHHILRQEKVYGAKPGVLGALTWD